MEKNSLNNITNEICYKKIISALVNNKHDELKDLLETYQPNLNTLTRNGYTFDSLDYAIENNDINIIRILLDYQPHNPAFALDLNRMRFEIGDCSYLSLAASRGRESVVSLFLIHNADPNLLEEDNSSSLHAAVSSGNLAIVKMLLEAGAASINQIANDFYSEQGYLLKDVAPIHIALTLKNFLPMVTLLVAYGADLNTPIQYLIDDGSGEGNDYQDYTLSEWCISDDKIKAFNEAVEVGLKLKEKLEYAKDESQGTATDNDSNVKEIQNANQIEGEEVRFTANVEETNEVNLLQEDRAKYESKQKEISNESKFSTPLENIVPLAISSWFDEIPEWVQKQFPNIKELINLLKQKASIYNSVTQEFLPYEEPTEDYMNFIQQDFNKAQILINITEKIDMTMVVNNPPIHGLILPTIMESGDFLIGYDAKLPDINIA